MPNWTYSQLKIKGDNKELQRFKKFAYSKVSGYGVKKENVLDTNKFIPYPKEFITITKLAEKHNEKMRVEREKKKNKILIALGDDSFGFLPDGFNSGGYEWCCANWGCYDKETEVLTTDGWKFFNDLKGNEKFFTINKNNEIEIHKSKKYIKKKHNGLMYQIKNSRANLLITPEHQIYFRARNTKNYKLMPMKDIKNTSFHLLKSGEWKGKDKKYFEIPNLDIKFRGTFPKIKVKMKDWLEFLGYFLADGSLSKSKCKRGGNQYYIHIAQKDKIGRKIIEKCIKKLPFKYYLYKDSDFIINNVNLYNYLKQFGKCNEKYIPKEIKELNKEKLKILYNALMFCDGTKDIAYYTTSKKLAEDFQEICLKLGLSTNYYIDKRKGRITKLGIKSNYDVCVIGISKRNETLVKKPQKIKYNGYVYCVVVPNHTLFVKRKGKSCWCGNSKWGICRAELIEENDKSIEYHFESAWCPIFPVINKMTLLFPTLTFRYACQEESKAFNFIETYKNGKTIKYVDKTKGKMKI